MNRQSIGRHDSALALLAAVFFWTFLPAVRGVSQVKNGTMPIRNSPWKADSVWLGAGMLVKDPQEPVEIEYRDRESTRALGELYLMLPNYPDSAFFLFHNYPDTFPDDPLRLSMGPYPKGTAIVLMYKVSDDLSGDLAYWYDRFIGERMYTGQNRVGIDPYVSDKEYAGRLTWGVVGRADSTTLEVGFEDYIHRRYKSMMLTVSNVYIEVIEKYKVSRPWITPGGGVVKAGTRLSMEVPYAGNIKIVDEDTTDHRPDSTAFKVRYTLDNTDPRTSATASLYTGDLAITESCTLKARAELPGDTNWFPSEVVTHVYTVEQSGVKGMRHPGRARLPQTIDPNAIVSIVRPSGEIVSVVQAREYPALASSRTLPPGIYLARFRERGKTRLVRIVLRGP